jgi:hypothetical protein
MNAFLFVFLFSLTNLSDNGQIAVGDFTGCVKNGLPCGWEKFKSTKGIVLERDSLGYFVNIKSKDDVEAICRRIQINVKDFSKLSWRWKVRAMPDSAREDIKKKNDCAAGIYIAFKGIYPFNHIIKYAWSTTLPEGTLLPSPYSKNTMVFIVRSGPEHMNQWMRETRDILSDYQKAFGAPPPLAEGIAIQSDSDNTRTCACADFADIFVSKN